MNDHTFVRTHLINDSDIFNVISMPAHNVWPTAAEVAGFALFIDLRSPRGVQ